VRRLQRRIVRLERFRIVVDDFGRHGDRSGFVRVSSARVKDQRSVQDYQQACFARGARHVGLTVNQPTTAAVEPHNSKITVLPIYRHV